MASARKDILDAAIREFAKAGFAGASTTAIARVSATKQPLLHYHYGSKAGLWRAAVDFAFVELGVTFGAIQETAADMSHRDQLKLMLRTLNRFATRHPRHLEIMRQEMGAESDQTTYLLKTHLLPIYEQIEDVIHAAAAAGEIKPVPPRFLSSLFLGAVSHYFSAGTVLRAASGAEADTQHQAKSHGDWLVEIFFNGLTATTQDKEAPGE